MADLLTVWLVDNFLPAPSVDWERTEQRLEPLNRITVLISVRL
jgi:hypothetical protein